MQIAIDPSGGFLRVTPTGALTYESFVEAFEALVAHESFHPGLNTLWDVRGARVAVAVGSDAAFGVARIYEALAADLPMEFRVFRDIEEAERWAAGPQPT